MATQPLRARARHLSKPLVHKQGQFFVGWNPGVPEPAGLEYQAEGSCFGWRRLMKGEKPVYVPDDPNKRTPERHELGDTAESAWPVGGDREPLDPWSRVAQLNLIRVADGTRLIFEATAGTAISEVEDLVSRITWLAADKDPGARPIVKTGTRQVRNNKGMSWWVPTFVITGWNTPGGSAPTPEIPPSGPESGTPPSAEARYAIGATPEARQPRQRKPRNAYQHLRQKESAPAASSLAEELDDKLPW